MEENELEMEKARRDNFISLKVRRINCEMCGFAMMPADLGMDVIFEKSKGKMYLTRQHNARKEIVHLCTNPKCHYAVRDELIKDNYERNIHSKN